MSSVDILRQRIRSVVRHVGHTFGHSSPNGVWQHPDDRVILRKRINDGELKAKRQREDLHALTWHYTHERRSMEERLAAFELENMRLNQQLLS